MDIVIIQAKGKQKLPELVFVIRKLTTMKLEVIVQEWDFQGL